MSDIKFRKMWKHIPIERRIEMVDYIRNMEPCLDKEVLELLFVKDMNPSEAAVYAIENNTLIGKQNKPLSRRRIEQISKLHFPDLYDYTPKSAHMRQAHREFLKEIKWQYCARCGGTRNIETHHMIPLFLGGTTDIENCIGLCKECHRAVSIYQRQHFPNYFKKKKSKTLDNGDVQLMF